LLWEDLQGLRLDSLLSQLYPLEKPEWAMPGVHLRQWVFSIFVPDVTRAPGVVARAIIEAIVCNNSAFWNVKT
jgi:hypothetical protein